MSKTQIIGICKICGQRKQLTREHIIPKSAGNTQTGPIYNGLDLIQNLKTPERLKKNIRQGGFTVNTLCKECNEKSGHWYDEDFSEFYLTFKESVYPQIKVPANISPADWLEGKKVQVVVAGKIKPLNIAKRILVTLCSAEFDNMTEDRYPEIRKAILDKNYQPDTTLFSIYLGLNLSNVLVFPLQAELLHTDKGFVTESYAGVESEVLSMYLAPHDEHLKGGHLTKCLDITSWLTKYVYDEVKQLDLELMFNKSLSIRFPMPSSAV
jgi:hypothetical protein